MDVYVCSEGEYTVYNDAKDSIRSGYLCCVRGIRSGKVRLQTVPSNAEILCHPQHIIDCGEYGVDTAEYADPIDDENYNEIDVDGENFAWNDCDDLPQKGSSVATVARSDDAGQTAELLRLQGYQTAALDLLIPIIENQREMCDVGVLVTAAKCYLHTGNREAAMQYLTRGHHLERRNVAVMCMLGNVCDEGGDVPAAQNWYSSAVEADKSSPLPYFFMASLQFRVHGLSQRDECIRLLRMGCADCVQVDSSQSPIDATAMYMRAATHLQQLHGDSELITRAYLRVVNIARCAGALEGPLPVRAVSSDTLRERLWQLELVSLREAAVDAFFELGRLLELTGKEMVHAHLASRADEPGQPWEPVSNKARKGKERKGSATTSRSPSEVPGMGFLHGARGAYWMCTSLGPSQTQHAEDLQRVESLLM